jgi:rSAM/selenodomain-associated transferase 1
MRDTDVTDSARTQALIVVAKRPAPGRTKTRLTPPLSAEDASALYECFLKDTLDLARRSSVSMQPAVAYLPAEERGYFSELAPDFELLLQEGHDLGTRLDNALSRFLSDGFQRVVIMNSDGPNLPMAYLEGAFAVLEGETDVVLGPCNDGGYYLIGMKRPAPRLLREVKMSTPNVVADTLRIAKEERLSVELLPEWYDVDDAAALARLARDLDNAPAEVAPHTREFLERYQALSRP